MGISLGIFYNNYVKTGIVLEGYFENSLTLS